MSTTDTAGVAGLARLLSRICRAPRLTVSQVVAESGLARSSAFTLARKLENAGLVTRDAAGVLAPGRLAVQLGFAAYGIAPLAGPAEALLTLLRDETDASVALVVAGESGPMSLLRLAARWSHGEGREEPTLTGPVADETGATRAWLTLTLRPDATRVARALAQAEFERIRISLEHYLKAGGHPP